MIKYTSLIKLSHHNTSAYNQSISLIDHFKVISDYIPKNKYTLDQTNIDDLTVRPSYLIICLKSI